MKAYKDKQKPKAEADQTLDERLKQIQKEIKLQKSLSTRELTANGPLKGEKKQWRFIEMLREDKNKGERFQTKVKQEAAKPLDSTALERDIR